MHTRHHVIASVIVATSIVGVYLYAEYKRVEFSHTNETINTVLQTATTNTVPQESSAPHAQQQFPKNLPSNSPPLGTAQIKIEDNIYNVDVYTGTTVLDAMQSLKESSDVQFLSREYPSLGSFVYAIQGKENAGGKYWMYYVNGVSATTGVSSAQLNPDDVIEWKYQTSY